MSDNSQYRHWIFTSDHVDEDTEGSLLEPPANHPLARPIRTNVAVGEDNVMKLIAVWECDDKHHQISVDARSTLAGLINSIRDSMRTAYAQTFDVLMADGSTPRSFTLDGYQWDRVHEALRIAETISADPEIAPGSEAAK